MSNKEEAPAPPPPPPPMGLYSGDSGALDSVNPNSFSRQGDEPWKECLDIYMAKEKQFLNRCRTGELTEGDVSIICTALEMSGTAGMTLDVFAAKLRLIEREMGDLIRKYPKIKRSLSIQQANKKGMTLETLVMTAHRSASGAKELLTNPEITKSLFERNQEENETRRADERCLEDLLERGYKPKTMVKLVYVAGHKVPEQDLILEGYDEVKQTTKFKV